MPVNAGEREHLAQRITEILHSETETHADTAASSR